MAAGGGRRHDASPECFLASMGSAKAAVEVLLFGALRERAGWARRSQPLAHHPPGLTPGALWRELGLAGADEIVGRDALPAGTRVAVNRQFASANTVLQAGDEVAFLPPISGG
jgi:molybdopterin synthase sulfur carrier subunit